MAVGEPSTSHHPIYRFTPRNVVKLQGYLDYLLGILSLKAIELKCSQSKGIADLRPQGHELEQLKKPPNLRLIQGSSWGKVTGQRGTRSSYVTPNKNPTKKSPSKHRHKNHKKGLRKSPKRKMGEATQGLEEPH
jgi:hypothetical protein